MKKRNLKTIDVEDDKDNIFKNTTLRIPAVFHVYSAGSEARTHVQYRATHRILLKSQRSLQLSDLLGREKGREGGRQGREGERKD